MKTKAYAGIGSRRTPPEILDLMVKVGEWLARKGYTLRSGAAQGADAAFERGCDLGNGAKEIFLPWPNFNGHKSTFNNPDPVAMNMAAGYHPAWGNCSQGARKLHARNVHQILGPGLRSPVKFVICWTDGTGGTEQALRIARHLDIPIFNLYKQEDRDRVLKAMQTQPAV